VVEAPVKTLDWSPQQAACLKAVEAWLKDPHGKQVFKIFGFAGTGKTELAKEIARMVRSILKGNALFAAFTGKAALVMRKKGCTGASTMHSLLYSVNVCEKTGEAEFSLNDESDLRDAKALIIDEVSMVDEILGQDAESFGKRIIVLGDPKQLKPVRGTGYFINGEPDVMLTEVHRQALDNPIIRMSMDIREGNRLQWGAWGDSFVGKASDLGRDNVAERVIGAGQVLCGINRSRHSMNRRIRELKGLRGRAQDWYPTNGDRVICLKNQRQLGIFNGGMWEVDHVQAKKAQLNMILSSLDEQRDPLKAKVFEEFFDPDDSRLVAMDWREKKKSLEFAFGWAITVHKSQGSQWDDILVFDESGAFGNERDNWLYTAVTRAAERVTVLV
jgi:exodeoxyribonuclease-5